MIRSMCWLIPVGLALTSFVPAVGHVDDEDMGIRWGGRLKTDDDVLAEAGLETSTTELLNALGDPRPLIRGTAAGKLLQKSDNNELREDEKPMVVSGLEAALLIEKDDFALIRIAYTLARFGRPSGYEQLRSVTKNAVDDETRLNAAAVLVSLGEKQPAYDLMIEVFRDHHASLGAQMAAASMLNDVELRDVLDEKTLNAAVGLLASQDPSVRHAVSYGLWRVGKCSVMPRLEELYRTEQDDEIRKDIGKTITRLDCPGEV